MKFKQHKQMNKKPSTKKKENSTPKTEAAEDST
jgi:hypothetical protein